MKQTVIHLKYRAKGAVIYAGHQRRALWEALAKGRTLCWVNINPDTMRVTADENKVTCKNCMKYLKPNKYDLKKKKS